MYESYSLQENDSLDTVANMFNIDKEKLMEINRLENERDVKEGTMVKVPVVDSLYYSTYVISKGDSLYGIARNYNINPELLASMNGVNMEDYIYPEQELYIPKAGYSYYITKDGDTLNTVANMFKTSIPGLLNNNSTVYLSEGQILVHKK